MVVSHIRKKDPLDDDKSSIVSHCAAWRHRASRKLSGSGWHHSAQILLTKVKLWPFRCWPPRVGSSTMTTNSKTHCTMQVYKHTNFHSHYCKQCNAKTLYIDLSDIVRVTAVLYHSHECKTVPQTDITTSANEQQWRKEAWLTCVWSVSINVLAEVEEKLGVVGWQLQLFAVLPEERVSISFNPGHLFPSCVVTAVLEHRVGITHLGAM